jgi:hypothetical protein
MIRSLCDGFCRALLLVVAAGGGWLIYSGKVPVPQFSLPSVWPVVASEMSPLRRDYEAYLRTIPSYDRKELAMTFEKYCEEMERWEFTHKDDPK